MNIHPEIDLKSAHIASFYGGGNEGTMTNENGLNYTFDAKNLTIDTIYGGGNKAGVTHAVTLHINAGHYTNVYGGSNSKGTVDATNIYIHGNVGSETGSTLTGKIFGGGRGSETTVNTTNVYLQNGIIAGNVYGGSGFGKVGSATVTAEEKNVSDNQDASDAKVQVLGNIFGAGFGVTSSAETTKVNVDLKLNIVDANTNGTGSTGDVQVKEELKDITDKSGESFATASWTDDNKKYSVGSYIAGNVFGGGDMGQVGHGYINVSTNTAVIEQGGTTNVAVSGGYIHGNVFGGGNGQPGGTDEADHAITEYTVYMGTVFGTSRVDITGGYVNGNVFGCGQQSRTYAADSKDGDDASDASMVTISTEDAQNPILIGGSIFGGGNKGNGTTQNASVATTYGDTHVTLKGNKGAYTPIYLLSNGTSGGGVYGDGNLCLVSGTKYVTLENFSCGVGKDVSMLKTFYSLQRADVVDLTGSRIVLKGAVDLVAENADDTQYSINRVGQLNLKESSTIKVTKTVNLLGELTSDEQTERQFIDRGNNNGNYSIDNNNYTAHGGTAPSAPLTEHEVNAYISDYDRYIAGNAVNDRSVNVVCVANGGYLEIKKSATEYGPVTGLFTLQLVNANPGEGGGFVYADIMGKKISSDNTDKYVTGNFICVTKQSDTSSEYMYAYHNVGGQLSADGKYEYYVWYLKGNKYSYNVDLTAYIGTTETDFTKMISLPTDPSQSFVLTELKQEKEVSGMDLETMYQNTWNAALTTDTASNKIAVEVTLVTNEKSDHGVTKNETAIGYLGYQTTNPNDPDAGAAKDADGNLVWGIWRNTEHGGWNFQPCANSDSDNSFQVSKGDALAQLDENVVNAQLKFTLHKGTGMTTEFRNLPFEMQIVEVDNAKYDGAVASNSYIQEDSCIRLTTNLNLSAIRLVPTQAAYMGSGRMFAGVSSSSTVNITDTSSFTAQFVTKYVPSAFNTGATNQIRETLTTKYTHTYLLDAEGVGYTVADRADGSVEILSITNTSDPNVSTYKITKNPDDTYKVSYLDENGNVMEDPDSEGKERVYTCVPTIQNSNFTLPKGTVITLLASLDENNPTYWYYYCTGDTTEVELSKFTEMNTANTNGADTVYKTISSTSSSRITENMIFVFDFSNVDPSEWEDASANVSELKGNVMLEHTYTNGLYTADIMDYVSSDAKNVDGQTNVSCKRETPKSTEEFKISTTTDGINKFELTNANKETNPSYGQREAMKFDLTITPDTSVTNTQYEEREYAVLLTLQKKTDPDTTTDVAFPEGTIFTYKGNKLSAGTGNKYVIVPVQTVGTHEIEIQGQLDGFDATQYQLTAKLYSTSADGYYNSLSINHTADQNTADFMVVADPTYALSVTETSDTDSDTSGRKRIKNHLVTQGDSLNFIVTAKEETATSGDTDSDPVEVQLYQYEKTGKYYKKTDLDRVLAAGTTPGAGTDQKWSPTVSANAQAGTYRLEFKYHDKVEYWDFIVK